MTSDRRRDVTSAHPLYAEAVRASTPPTRARVIWGRLADLLQATGARRVGDLLRLATWKLGAGDVADAPLFVTAARRALVLEDFAAGRAAGSGGRRRRRWVRRPPRARRVDARTGPRRGGRRALRRSRAARRGRRGTGASRAAPQRSPLLLPGSPRRGHRRPGARRRHRVERTPGATPSWRPPPGSSCSAARPRRPSPPWPRC